MPAIHFFTQNVNKLWFFVYFCTNTLFVKLLTLIKTFANAQKMDCLHQQKRHF